MYERFVVLKRIMGTDGQPESITLGLFDEKGILQLEIPKVSPKLIPYNATVGKSLRFDLAGVVVSLTKKM